MQSIQWFPGHMHRTRRQLAELLPKTDVVIEILDARLPAASRNPLLHQLRGAKPCVVVLNKSDLADPGVTRAWVRHWRDHDLDVLPLVASDPKASRGVLQAARTLAPPRNFRMRPLVLLIAGIPNVGKSTLLNTLAGRKVSLAADKAAITRAPKRIHLDEETTLYDTPGVLWPKLEDQHDALLLAASGAIRETALDLWTVAVGAVALLQQYYPERLKTRYGITGDGTPEEFLWNVGKRRGCLRAGGVVDEEKAAQVLLGDLRSGKLGRISFQKPPA
ncbi:MAG TPA: ribosome biogenesis GTPase YlqF [Desulfomicrobiaceae bacterium]|nr:ribosome biogenesis GTPase YlqF [Desulfomicrobiaceae bacterium]